MPWSAVTSGGVRVELRVLGRARLVEQVLDHGDGAAVVRDHQLEEQPVERHLGGGFEPVHLLVGQHARHRRPARLVMGVDVGDRLVALPQPVPHHRDLVLLRDVDPLGQLSHHVAFGTGLEQRGHLERLGVMRDHPLHELDVAVGVADAGQVGRLLGRDLPARLARRGRLDDRRLRLADGGHADERDGGGQGVETLH